jgi:hypothetical protein
MKDEGKEVDMIFTLRDFIFDLLCEVSVNLSVCELFVIYLNGIDRDVLLRNDPQLFL